MESLTIRHSTPYREMMSPLQLIPKLLQKVIQDTSLRFFLAHDNRSLSKTRNIIQACFILLLDASKIVPVVAEIS